MFLINLKFIFLLLDKSLLLSAVVGELHGQCGSRSAFARPAHDLFSCVFEAYAGLARPLCLDNAFRCRLRRLGPRCLRVLPLVLLPLLLRLLVGGLRILLWLLLLRLLVVAAVVVAKVIFILFFC